MSLRRYAPQSNASSIESNRLTLRLKPRQIEQMVRKFRFSLLGLLAFTAVLAVIFNFFTPLLIEIPTSEWNNQFPEVALVDNLDVDIRRFASKSTTTTFIATRTLKGIRFYRGPVIYRFANGNDLIMRTDDFLVAPYMLIENEDRDTNAKYTIEDRPAKLVAIINDVDSKGDNLDRYSYLVSDKGNAYFAFNNYGSHLVFVYPFKEDLSDPQFPGEKLRVSTELLPTIKAEVERAKKLLTN
jgi:hypothetical protein